MNCKTNYTVLSFFLEFSLESESFLLRLLSQFSLMWLWLLVLYNKERRKLQKKFTHINYEIAEVWTIIKDAVPSHRLYVTPDLIELLWCCVIDHKFITEVTEKQKWPTVFDPSEINCILSIT